MPKAFIPTRSRNGARKGSPPPSFPAATETYDDNAARENHSSIEHDSQTIDPRLLGAQVDQLARSLSTPRSSSTLECNSDSTSSKHDGSQNLLPIPPVDQVISKNDFDIEFEETEGEQKHLELKSDAIPYLLAWSSQNNGQLPAGLQLQCLEILTGAPQMILVEWLRVNVLNLPAQHNTHLHHTAATDDLGQYQARCLDSNSRYRSGQRLLRNSRLFECTSRCGQSFHRKGDWARHERLNFEEWKCPSCPEVRSRWTHLHTHLKKFHNSEGIRLRIQPHYFLKAQQRACGFCACDFDDWRQWLSHVGAHFEGTLHGGARRMSDWKEKFRPHVEQQQDPASGFDTVVDSEQFEFNSFTYGTGYHPFSPGNIFETFSGSPDGDKLPCQQLTRAHHKNEVTPSSAAIHKQYCEMPNYISEAVKETYSTTVEDFIRCHEDERPPPNTAAEMQYGPSRNNYLDTIKEEEYDDFLVHSMAMLSVNGRVGVQSEDSFGSSNSSWSGWAGPTDCVGDLQKIYPAAPMAPGTVLRAPDPRRVLKRSILRRYMEDKRDAPWSAYNLRRRDNKNKIRPHL
jgi:hypothetical protein